MALLILYFYIFMGFVTFILGTMDSRGNELCGGKKFDEKDSIIYVIMSIFWPLTWFTIIVDFLEMNEVWDKCCIAVYKFFQRLEKK